MGSIQNPIGDKPPRDPYEGYRVEPPQEKTGPKDRFQKEPDLPPEKAPVVLAYLYSLLRKVVDLFEEKTARGVPERIEADVRAHLGALSASFVTLKEEDRSQDVSFLNALSMQWHQVLEDSLRFRRASPFATALRQFVRGIQEYPPGEEHSLGYYLSEYAGQSWLPFPYLALMRRLHQEKEIIDRWVGQIDNLIGLLSSN